MASSEHERLIESLRRWLSTGGTVESTGSRGAVSDATLTTAVEQHLHRLSEHIAARGEPVRSAGELRFAATQVVADARRALEKTAAGESPNNLTDRERSCLEAIVRVTGRPATRFLASGLEIPDQDLGANEKWALVAGQMFEKIEAVADSVGRVSIGSPGGTATQLGTAWRVGADLVVTNRHVARDVVSNPTDAPSTWTLKNDASCFVDFAATHAGGPSKAFAIGELAFCADDQDLDAAVFRLTAPSPPPPRALSMSFDRAMVLETLQRSDGTSTDRGKDVYVIGHPYRESASEASWLVFGDADGKKRWSPGEITLLDAARGACQHDCSTLGGSSGSCIVALASHRVVGMHFGGTNVDEVTGRGDANLGLSFALLKNAVFQRILETGTVA